MSATPCFVVRDAKAVRAIPVNPKGLPREHPGQVDGIHVREEQNPCRARSTESTDDGLPRARRRVLEPDHVSGRVDELHLAAQRPEASGDELGDEIQPLDVGAARLDGDQVPKGVEIGLSFLLDAREHRLCRLRERPGGNHHA